MDVQRGISLRELDDLWLAAGGEIFAIRRTGERRYVQPSTGRRSHPFSHRRKDAPIRLVMFVRRALQRREAQ